ncbi:MAG: hypothetical protein QF819_00205 [Gemmatimonadota bacterium]|jgi:hypothetical protein|nr:hypothetical protein [Gemmatimonadota bacterium]MDP6461405.1 hypothetical protein [Gemmatimonadota bacterium]MDP6528579.1 hypothetical protein [Gemmatimonadota bacterium]MDP6801585.1 hypothetical protein [Gemmatimonadota bacterium]MDP7030868.1 hypothetical protein [Gemmatimonadota bacterium]
MKKTLTVLTVCALASVFVASASAGPWYARGDYYCAPGCWGADGGNELFDDGLHGDGAAGDGVYGCDTSPDQNPGRYDFKIALGDWSSSFPGSNQWVHVSGAADIIHFSLDTNSHGDGWIPDQNIVWNSHFAPAGTAFEVVGGPPEIGAWGSGLAGVLNGDIWSVTVPIAATGTHESKWRAVGSWDVQNIGGDGGASAGGNLTFEVTTAGTPVLFEFNQATGRSRVTVDPPVSVDDASWGSVKGTYK